MNTRNTPNRINPVGLTAALTRREMTVTELAGMSGVSRGTISALKAGKRCRPETAAKLAAVLGESIFEKFEDGNYDEFT